MVTKCECDLSSGYMCVECSQEKIICNLREALVWAITELKIKPEELPLFVKAALEWEQ